MLVKHGHEVSDKCHVVADEHPVADGHRQAHGFVIGVADADREVYAGEAAFEVEHTEHLHPVAGHGVFVAGDGNVPEGERLDKRGDDFRVRDRAVGGRNGIRLRNRSIRLR